VIFEVLTAVLLNIQVFLDVTPHWLVATDVWKYCIAFIFRIKQSQKSGLLDPQD
jgi:hypothetical protein